MGASPDGIISRSCGPGLLEIKCPYSKRDVDITDSEITDNQFYLEGTDSSRKLKCDHDYNMQIQGQLFVC